MTRERFLSCHVIDRGKGFDPIARDLPGLLNHPGERAILTVGFLLNLLQHFLREVERLLSFVGTSHQRSPGNGRADYLGNTEDIYPTDSRSGQRLRRTFLGKACGQGRDFTAQSPVGVSPRRAPNGGASAQVKENKKRPKTKSAPGFLLERF